MKTITTMIALLVTITLASAQGTKNYWVVESGSTKASIVKIYDANNQLVTESKVNRKIDITRKKNRRMLNKMASQNDALLWSKR